MDALHRALLVDMLIFSLFAVLYGQDKKRGEEVGCVIMALFLGLAFIFVP